MLCSLYKNIDQAHENHCCAKAHKKDSSVMGHSYSNGYVPTDAAWWLKFAMDFFFDSLDYWLGKPSCNLQLIGYYVCVWFFFFWLIHVFLFSALSIDLQWISIERCYLLCHDSEITRFSATAAKLLRSLLWHPLLIIRFEAQDMSRLV
jgi:hypothetical protein